jgi:hypothetical protein
MTSYSYESFESLLLQGLASPARSHNHLLDCLEVFPLIEELCANSMFCLHHVVLKRRGAYVGRAKSPT